MFLFRAAEIAYSLAWAEMEYIGSDKVIHLQNLPAMPVIVIPCPRFGLKLGNRDINDNEINNKMK